MGDGVVKGGWKGCVGVDAVVEWIEEGVWQWGTLIDVSVAFSSCKIVQEM